MTAILRNYRVAAKILIILVILSTIGPITNIIPRANASDTIITGNTIWEKQTIYSEGSIIIENGGNLTLKNTTLIMKLASDGAYNITVKSGGVLWIVDNSTIESNSTYRFIIYMEPGATLYVDNSTIDDLGYSNQPGIKTIEGGTSRIYILIVGSRVDVTAFYLAGSTVKIQDSNVNITQLLTVDVFQVLEGTDLTIDESNVTIIGTRYTGHFIRVNGPLTANSSRVRILGSNITGPYEALISRPSGSDTQTIRIVIEDSYIKDTYADSYTSSYIGGYTELYIINSTIEHSWNIKPLFRVYKNVHMEIDDSRLLNSYIYVQWSSSDTGWESISITDSVVDYGIMVPKDDYRLTLDHLYVSNVANSKGQKLLMIKGKTGEYVVDEEDNPYQVIILDSPGPIIVKNVTLNSTYQPFIVSNSTIEIRNTTIEVEGEDSREFFPRVILSINNTNILINNSRIKNNDNQEGVSIEYVNGGNLTIINSNLIIKREYFISVFSKDSSTTDKVYIKIRNTTISIRSRITYGDKTGDQSIEPIMIIENTTWTGHDNYFNELVIGVPARGKLIVNNSKFLDISAYGFYNEAWNVFRPYENSYTEINNSVFRILGTDPLARIDKPGSIFCMFNNTINYTDRGEIIAIESSADDGIVWIENNTVNGPGSDELLSFARISTSEDNETVKIINNTISGAMIGILIDSSVVESKIIEVKDNDFKDMGGIIFKPGSNADQTIEGNTVDGEPIVYLNGASNLEITETTENPMGQLIIAYSHDITVNGYESNRENINIQVISSENINIQGFEAKTSSKDYTIHNILITDSSNVIVKDSEINSSVKPSPIQFDGTNEGGLYLVDSKDVLVDNSVLRLIGSATPPYLIYLYNSGLTVKNTNITLDYTPYGSESNVYGIKARYSTIHLENVNATPLKYYRSVFLRAEYSNVFVVDTLIHDSDGGTGISGDHSNITVRDTVFRGKLTAIDAYYGTMNISGVQVISEDSSDDLVKANHLDWVIIRDSHIRGHVIIQYMDDVFIENVTINSTWSPAIGIYDVVDVFVKDSRITWTYNTPLTGRHSIRVYRSHNVTFMNVTVKGGYGNGIQLDQGSDAVMVNSTIKDNKAYGVYVTGSSSFTGYYLSITGNGNFSEDAKYDGIFVDSGLVEVHDSVISSNFRLGAYSTGIANLTGNYWGSSSGPDLLNDASYANEVDPEEILDPGNETLTGNEILYGSFLSSSPVPEAEVPNGWLVEPDNGSTILGLANLTFQATDNKGVAFTVIMVDGRVEAVLYGTNQTYRWDTTTVPDGEHRVNLITIDYSGNIDNKTYIFKVSNVHPYVEILWPKENYTWASGTGFPIKVFSSDNNPDKLEVYINNSRKVTWTGNLAVGERTYYLDTTQYSDGNILEVRFTLTDVDGFSDSSIVYLRVDNTPPTASVNEPGNNSYVPELFIINGSLNDNLEFQRGDLRFNGSLVYQTDAAGDWSFDVNLTEYGYKTGDVVELNLTGVDGANNTKTIIYYYIVDMVFPSSEITSPENNTQVSGVVNINIRASDNYGVKKVQLYINGTMVKEWNYDPKNVEEVYEWDTSDYGPGTYEVKVVSVDVAGNTNTTTYYFEVLATPIPESNYIALMVVIVAVIMLYVYMSKLRISNKS